MGQARGGRYPRLPLVSWYRCKTHLACKIESALTHWVEAQLMHSGTWQKGVDRPQSRLNSFLLNGPPHSELLIVRREDFSELESRYVGDQIGVKVIRLRIEDVLGSVSENSLSISSRVMLYARGALVLRNCSITTH